MDTRGFYPLNYIGLLAVLLAHWTFVRAVVSDYTISLKGAGCFSKVQFFQRLAHLETFENMGLLGVALRQNKATHQFQIACVALLQIYSSLIVVLSSVLRYHV
jgi:hypothetical protein